MIDWFLLLCLCAASVGGDGAAAPDVYTRAHRADLVAPVIGRPDARESAPGRMQEEGERPAAHLQERVAHAARVYPWLLPQTSAQWLRFISMLSLCAGMFVHVSVKIGGAERPPIGRSMAVGLLYLLACAAQAALVPPAWLALHVWLPLNAAASLLLLRRTFGLTVGGALTAQAAQLGLAAGAYAMLEVARTVLVTVDPSA